MWLLRDNLRGIWCGKSFNDDVIIYCKLLRKPALEKLITAEMIVSEDGETVGLVLCLPFRYRVLRGTDAVEFMFT